MGHNDDVLNEPVGFVPDVDDYVDFLESGVQAFNEKY